MNARTRPVVAFLASISAVMGIAGLGASPGCGASIEDTQPPPHDAGDEGDAEAGPPLQCWCDGTGADGIPMDHGEQGYLKCDAGWICGLYGNQEWYCCPPRDEGSPNCEDTDAKHPNGNATPNGLACKPMPW